MAVMGFCGVYGQAGCGDWLTDFFKTFQVPPRVLPAFLTAADGLAAQTPFDVFALDLPRLTSPIGRSVAMRGSLLQFIIPN